MSSLITWEKNPDVLNNIKPKDGNKIPKIIHFCWFGKSKMPEELVKCMDTWKVLKGYIFFRWDESNCTFDENDFVKKAYEEKQYVFVSDYYRLKALHDYGGIYLDTDVLINKSFDDFLKYDAFLNFITDCSIGTDVIGSKKGGELINNIYNLYDKCIMLPETEKRNRKDMVIKDGQMYAYGFPVSNYSFTYYILKNYPGFKLNNRFQNLGDFVISPKELFEIGTLSKKHYTIHLCAGGWIVQKKNTIFRKRIKAVLYKNEFLFVNIQILVRKIRYIKLKKINPFYQYYLAQKKGWELPEL